MAIPLAAFITPYSAPGSSYRGAAGSMMELGNLRERSRSNKAQEALGSRHADLRQQAMGEEQRQFNTQEAERQRQIREKLFREWQEAERAGDPQRAEAARQALERHGMKRGASSQAAQAPLTLGEVGQPQGAMSPADAEVEKGLDEFDASFSAGMGIEPGLGRQPNPSEDPVATSRGNESPEERMRRLEEEQDFQSFLNWSRDNPDRAGVPEAYEAEREAWLRDATRKNPGVHLSRPKWQDGDWSAGASVASGGGEWPVPAKAAPTLPGDPLPSSSAPAERAVPPPASGGRQVIYGPDGRELGSYDSGAHRPEQQARVAAAFVPLIDNATSPEEAAAARAAQGLATKLLGTHPPEVAIQMGLDTYNRASGRSTARRVAGGGGPGFGSGGIPTKAEMKMTDEEEKLWDIAFQQAHKNTKIEKFNEAGVHVQDALNLLASPDGLAQRQAQQRLMKAVSGAAYSARELDLMEGGAGAWEQLKNQVKKYTDEGTLTEEFRRQLQGVFISMAQRIQEARRNAGQMASHIALARPANVSPERREEIAKDLEGAFVGQYRKRGVSQSGTAVPRSGGESGGGSAQQKAREYLKKKGLLK